MCVPENTSQPANVGIVCHRCTIHAMQQAANPCVGKGMLAFFDRRQKTRNHTVPGFLVGRKNERKMYYLPRLWTSMGIAASKETPYQRASGSLAVSFMHSRV